MRFEATYYNKNDQKENKQTLIVVANDIHAAIHKFYNKHEPRKYCLLKMKEVKE